MTSRYTKFLLYGTQIWTLLPQHTWIYNAPSKSPGYSDFYGWHSLLDLRQLLNPVDAWLKGLSLGAKGCQHNHGVNVRCTVVHKHTQIHTYTHHLWEPSTCSTKADLQVSSDKPLFPGDAVEAASSQLIDVFNLIGTFSPVVLLLLFIFPSMHVKYLVSHANSICTVGLDGLSNRLGLVRLYTDTTPCLLWAAS